MADPTLLVRKYLLQNSALTTLLGGQNVFGGDLPPKFDPTRGPVVTVCAEGGSSYAEVPIATDRVKIRIWAGVAQYMLARQVYGELAKWLHGKNQINLAPDGFIIISQETVRGQDVTDPDDGYATVLSFYQITTRESSPDEPLSFSIPHGLGVAPSAVSVLSLSGQTAPETAGFDATNLFLSPAVGGLMALVYVYPDPGPSSGEFYVPYGLVTIPTVADPVPVLTGWEGTSYDSIPDMGDISEIVLVYL